MLGRYRNSYIEINLQQLEQNYLAIKNLVPNSSLIPMVKADAYGHGDLHVSQLCERLSAKYLGVALIEEGVKLRLAGIQTPILLFGFFDSIGAEAIVKYRMTPVLSRFDQIAKLKASLHESAGFPVHIEFNTGMQRNGFELTEAKRLIQEFKKEGFLKLEGICTHFISGEDYGNPVGRSRSQEKAFTPIVQEFKAAGIDPICVHVSSSGGIFAGLRSGYEAFRPGLSLYGITNAPEKNIKPVLTLKSQVVHFHQLKKGDTVSYGGTWKASQDTQIAVIPLGYGDGIPRTLSNKARVLIGGVGCPIRGVICMDYFMVEIGKNPLPATVGDEVILIGSQKQESIDVNEWALHAGTSPYEILTGFQVRIPRVYIH